MNKNRSTQILEILLLPYSYKEREESRIFIDFFTAYAQMLSEDNIGIAQAANRRKLMGQFGSAKKKLIDYLVEKCTCTPRNLDDVSMLFELFFPKDEILDMQCESIEDKLYCFYICNLVKIAESLLTFRDGMVSIRTWNREGSEKEDIFGLQQAFDKVEIWNQLSRIITTDTLVALFIVQCGLNMTALYEQSSMISLSDKLLGKVLQKGMAETHLHLNAGYDFQTMWEKNMDLNLWRKILTSRNDLSKTDLKLLFIEAVIRICLISFLNGTQESRLYFDEYGYRYLPEYIRNFVADAFSGSRRMQQEPDTYEKILDFYIGHHAQLHREDYLFQDIYKDYKELHTGSEIIFLYQCFAYEKRQRDPYFRRIFLNYIRIKNAFYHKSTQRNGMQGLDLFRRFYDHAKKAAYPDHDAKILMQAALHKHLNMSFLKKLEVRVAPDYGKHNDFSLEYEVVRENLKRSLAEQTERILSAYRMLMLERLVSVQQAERIAEKERKTGHYLLMEQLKKEYAIAFKEFHFPTIGIVFHFLKRESLDDIAGFFCWRGIEDDLVKYSDHRLILRKKMANMAKAIEELRSEVPYLHEYIVGIDAASNENAAEPWIMSPAFQLIRTKYNIKPVLHTSHFGANPYQKIANIGFTYHVGEDFRHPLSGLRHVDEVLGRFFYKSGDRLGHAIVLGMDIERWILENEIVELKAREELENYLWLWGKMMYDGWNAPVQMNVLEGRILSLAEDIYDVYDRKNLNNMDVALLYKAYELKFDTNHEQILKDCLADETEHSAGAGRKSGTFCKYSKDACALSGYSFWNEKKLLCTQYCPVFERRCERVKLVSVSEADIPLLQFIQDKLIDKIERLGIFIETNPTSNLTIGEICQMSRHPIFKLNALTDAEHMHHAMVTINADDPAVFHTDVENEIAYVYHALEHDGYKKEQILRWIDKIREYGLLSSFVSETKDTETMLTEITDILNILSRRRKRI